MQAIVADLGVSLDEAAEIALRYTLSHPAVSTVIPGMHSVRNAERNCALGDGRGLTPAEVGTLTAHRWVRSYDG